MPKKMILDIDDKTWVEVQKYKLENTLRNNNEAVVKLIKKALETQIKKH